MDYEPSELEDLKKFIPSVEYQRFASKHTASHARLAKILDFLGSPPAQVGWRYLQASWQVEDDPAAHHEYLSLGLRYYRQALDDKSESEERLISHELLAAELERRLGLFAEAEQRLRRVKTSSEDLEEFLVTIVDYQLQLVGEGDQEPHEIPER